MKKNGSIVVLNIMILLVILFVAIKVMSNVRETTKQDYLYYKSSYGLMGFGSNTDYEIGSFSNKDQINSNFGGVISSSEYNKLDDSIYLLPEIGCQVTVIERNGKRSALDYCHLNNKKITYSPTSIFFDKKNYKYLILNGGFGEKNKYVNAIAVFNDKQQLVKVVNSDFFINSLAIAGDKLIYSQANVGNMDVGNATYLTIYDLKTNKETTYDYRKKNKNFNDITAIMQLDDDYLIAYKGKDSFNYVINSQGKVINKSKNTISSTRPSYKINDKWYLSAVVYATEEDAKTEIIEYTKNSFKRLKFENKCEYYSIVMFNNKSIYCISKKDNKKLLSLLPTDKNTYTLEKKYEYALYHDLALFGFK